MPKFCQIWVQILVLPLPDSGQLVLNSLILSFLICNIRAIMPFLLGTCEIGYREQLAKQLALSNLFDKLLTYDDYWKFKLI